MCNQGSCSCGWPFWPLQLRFYLSGSWIDWIQVQESRLQARDDSLNELPGPKDLQTCTQMSSRNDNVKSFCKQVSFQLRSNHKFAQWQTVASLRRYLCFSFPLPFTETAIQSLPHHVILIFWRVLGRWNDLQISSNLRLELHKVCFDFDSFPYTGALVACIWVKHPMDLGWTSSGLGLNILWIEVSTNKNQASGMSASSMNSLSSSNRFLLHPAHATYFSTKPGESPTGFAMRRPSALYNVLLSSIFISLLVISLIFWRSDSSIGLTWDSNSWHNLFKDKKVGVWHACQWKVKIQEQIYILAIQGARIMRPSSDILTIGERCGGEPFPSSKVDQT